jgi:hypothetical protein
VGFEAICFGIVALLMGLAMLFAGFRLFLLLLPVWGFLVGFFVGASALAWLLGDSFLATFMGWAVGFILGLILAILSYLFYLAGVAIIAGSIGYALGSGLVFLVSDDLTVLAFIVGLVAAIIVAIVTLSLNLQKLVLIAITSIGGASAIFTSLMLIFNQIELSDIGTNPVRAVIDQSIFWFLLWLGLAGLGFATQFITSADYELEPPESGRSW